MAIDIKLLPHLPLFKGLPQPALDRLGRQIFSRQVPAGDVIFLESDAPDSLYLMAGGVARIFKTSAEGKEQIIEMVRPGGLLNEVAFVDGQSNPFSAEAATDVTIYGLHRPDWDALVRDYPHLSGNLIALMAARQRGLVELVEDLSFRTVSARVAKILLQFAGDGPGGARLTQREMAAMAGTAREVVGRSLRYLKESGAIRFENHRIVVADKASLEALTGIGET